MNSFISKKSSQTMSHCTQRWTLKRFLFVCATGFYFQLAHAALVDCNLVDQSGWMDAPGGCIVKPLAEQIGAGHGDAFTSGTSGYLIKRDPARAIRRGRQLFNRKTSKAEGQGPRVNHTSSGDIVANRALGAGLADSCSSCHGRPRGSAGFGGAVATRPDSRDAPHLFGLGLVEQLADEMTGKLRAIKERALVKAQQKGRCITRKLRVKGVSFGKIKACPDGTVDTSQVVGVAGDLRIRPFFSQGGTISMREFIVGAFNAEMGMQAWDPVLCAVTEPGATAAVVSPAGFKYDPAKDTFERPPVCDAVSDADGDGVVAEIDPAIIDYIEFYLLNYFKPGLYEQTSYTRLGLRLMERIGCTSCHKRNMTIDSDRRVADVETRYRPKKAIFNGLFAQVSTLFSVVDDGNKYPLLVPDRKPFTVKNFFSDLKRHDLGPAFHERDYDGTRVTHFVTEPLWGVGSTAPYGHDGRSINLDQVIRRHGGEAETSRLAYQNLPGWRRGAIIAFLQTLILFPPDDTASNLNPGNPGTADPQSPSEHGSISLPPLFQIPEEGAE